jgi:hypothetical protein
MNKENLIRIQCQTNLDEFKNTEWPTYCLCKPEIGDYVQSIDGKYSLLKIKSIIHGATKISTGIGLVEEHIIPILFLDLNK